MPVLAKQAAARELKIIDGLFRLLAGCMHQRSRLHLHQIELDALRAIAGSVAGAGFGSERARRASDLAAANKAKILKTSGMAPVQQRSGGDGSEGSGKHDLKDQRAKAEKRATQALQFIESERQLADDITALTRMADFIYKVRGSHPPTRKLRPIPSKFEMTRASRQHTHANRAAAAQALMATFLKNTRSELYIGLRVVHGVGLVGEKKGLRPMAGATARFLDVLIGQIKPSIIIPLAKRDSLPTHEAAALCLKNLSSNNAELLEKRVGIETIELLTELLKSSGPVPMYLEFLEGAPVLPLVFADVALQSGTTPSLRRWCYRIVYSLLLPLLPFSCCCCRRRRRRRCCCCCCRCCRCCRRRCCRRR
jgi:hypothetical protein